MTEKSPVSEQRREGNETEKTMIKGESKSEGGRKGKEKGLKGWKRKRSEEVDGTRMQFEVRKNTDWGIKEKTLGKSTTKRNKKK